MRKSCFIAVICVFSFQACEKGLIIEDTEHHNEFVENEIHCIVTAGLPSDQKAPETRVVLDGDSPSAPIVAQWRGSTSSFQDRFAIIGEDNDGGIAHVTDALRLVDETEDSVSGTFEFSFDKDYWIDDLDYRWFYALYPVRDYDSSYYTGSDDDNENWLYRFSEQSGSFSDLTHNLFMVSPQIDLDNPSIEFQYGIAILRLSNLHIPDLIGKTVSNIKVKSNAIRDAIVFNSSCSFSDYYAAGNEISITGSFNVNSQGIIDDNIYIVFYPSSDSLEYLTLSLIVNGLKYSYSYSGSLTDFSAGKVYTLNGAELSYKDTSPDYNWYLNPMGEGHYLISNAKEFLGFQRIVNGDEDALSIVGIEEADKFDSKIIDLVPESTIDLSDVLDTGENWIPIDGFRGTLNGGGATVVNLFIGGSFQNYANVGLFATIESAKIESLIVKGTLNIEYCWMGRIGGLVGYSIQSVINNCSSEVNLTYIRSDYGGGGSIGGVVGSASQSYIIGCCDSSMVTSKSDLEECAGGIVGGAFNWSSIVACSHLNSTVYVNNYSRSTVGGIVGNDGGDTTISACYNSGKISSGYRSGGQIDGGSTMNPYKISSCYYSGESNNAYSGVGINYGSSFDSGTQRVNNEAEMFLACEDMNSVINEWNSSNPTMQCSRRYHVENGQIVFN